MAAIKKKVLIIDDQEEIRDLISITLYGSESEIFLRQLTGVKGYKSPRIASPI